MLADWLFLFFFLFLPTCFSWYQKYFLFYFTFFFLLLFSPLNNNFNKPGIKSVAKYYLTPVGAKFYLKYADLLGTTSESYSLQVWFHPFFLFLHDQHFTHTCPLRPLKLVINSHSWLLSVKRGKKKKGKNPTRLYFSVEQGRTLPVNAVQSPGDPGIS